MSNHPPPVRWEAWQWSIPEAAWARIWRRSESDRRGALNELRQLYWSWLRTGRGMRPRLFGEPELPPPPRRRRRRGPHDWELGQNPDPSRRELARAAAAGDPEAMERLHYEMVRVGDPIDYTSQAEQMLGSELVGSENSDSWYLAGRFMEVRISEDLYWVDTVDTLEEFKRLLSGTCTDDDWGFYGAYDLLFMTELTVKFGATVTRDGVRILP